MPKAYPSRAQHVHEMMSPCPITGCVWWLGAARANYACFPGGGYVHRWLMGNPPGATVMHICDQPMCVNKGHLRVGTQRANMADMKAKGRGSGNIKLPAETLLRAAELTQRMPQAQAAALTGVSRATLCRFLSGKQRPRVQREKA